MRRSHLSRLSLSPRHWRAGHRRPRRRAVKRREDAVVIPPPAAMFRDDGLQTAVVAGGCFRGVQGRVSSTPQASRAPRRAMPAAARWTATYEQVSTGSTGHAGVVQIKYDPTKSATARSCRFFFSVVHDPTQLNRQGPDFRHAVRSAIFTILGGAEEGGRRLYRPAHAAKVYSKPIVPRSARWRVFFPAEAYHQTT